ncbi:MAG: hypothetical protein RLZZ628_3273 [Bacteroidota bacterium]
MNEIQFYKNNELSESQEKQIEKSLFDKMIRQDYEQFLQAKGLYEPSKPILQPAKLRFLPFLKAASIVLMLSGAGYWLHSTTRNPVAAWEIQVNQNLAEQEELPQTRLDDKHDAVKRQAFQQAYRNQEFEKASLALQSMDAKSKDDFYYWGLCNLYLSNPQYIEAVKAFQKASELGKEEAVWYMALAQIKLKDKLGARQSLQKYLDYGRDWKRVEAERLLKQL